MSDALTRFGGAANARGVDRAEPGQVRARSGPVRVAEDRTKPGPGARLALRVLRLYKVLISPLFAGSCRYLPSCSDYAAEAIERHGVAAGIGLGARRLCRCNPFGGSGHDPVPGSNPWRALFVDKGRAEKKTGDRAQSDSVRAEGAQSGPARSISRF